MNLAGKAFFAGQLDAIETVGASVWWAMIEVGAAEASLVLLASRMSRDDLGIPASACKVSKRSSVRDHPHFAGGAVIAVENFRSALVASLCSGMITFSEYLAGWLVVEECYESFVEGWRWGAEELQIMEVEE